MPEPWENPLPPTQGDHHDDATYAGVGRVTSRWEEVEIELAHLYSVFAGTPNESAAVRAYGAGRIFRDRLGSLNSAADRFFIANPNQVWEGTYGCLRNRALAFSERRNDIAHGVVRQMRWIPSLKARMPSAQIVRVQFCLVPPHYLPRRFDPSNAPTFAYTSTELLRVEEGLYWHVEAIKEFSARLHPETE